MNLVGEVLHFQQYKLQLPVKDGAADWLYRQESTLKMKTSSSSSL